MKRNLIIAALVVLAGCYAGNASAQSSGTQNSGTNTNAQSGTTGNTTQNQGTTQGTRRNRGTGTSSQAASDNTNAGAAKTSRSFDQVFAKRAAEGGLAEVKLGQLAQEKGSSQTVKDFSKKMVDDHGKANDQLKQWASKTSFDLPSDVNAKDKAQYDKLSKLSGAEFDRAYARMMLRDHTKDLAEFQREAKNGKDDDLKNWANSTLPTLQEHLKMAHDMLNEVQQSTKTNQPKNQNNQTRTSGS